MLPHEESPEKPQYNMATHPPSISRQTLPPFLAKIFNPHPISINFEKVDTPFMKGGGEFELCKPSRVNISESYISQFHGNAHKKTINGTLFRE